jgi:hypothetical protein
MTAKSVTLIDPSRNVVATAQVVDKGTCFAGTVDLQTIPDNMRELFEDFEEVVCGQLFSSLDNLQERIASLGLKAVFEEGGETFISDLQIYPSTGDVSFKLVREAVHRTGTA